jgi:hypothetical protein
MGDVMGLLQALGVSGPGTGVGIENACVAR